MNVWSSSVCMTGTFHKNYPQSMVLPQGRTSPTRGNQEGDNKKIRAVRPPYRSHRSCSQVQHYLLLKHTHSLLDSFEPVSLFNRLMLMLALKLADKKLSVLRRFIRRKYLSERTTAPD